MGWKLEGRTYHNYEDYQRALALREKNWKVNGRAFYNFDEYIVALADRNGPTENGWKFDGREYVDPHEIDALQKSFNERIAQEQGPLGADQTLRRLEQVNKQRIAAIQEKKIQTASRANFTGKIFISY